MGTTHGGVASHRRVRRRTRSLKRPDRSHPQTFPRDVWSVPRVHAELEAQGERLGAKRVARLMRALGLEGVSRRRHTRTTVRGRDARPAPDRVERKFSADAPDRLWVADITYCPTWAGFLFLAVVIDVYSRRVVGCGRWLIIFEPSWCSMR